jgi:hypothetical protein
MKHVSTFLFAAVLALAGVGAAQAFTFESTAPGDGSGNARNYLDPQDQIEPKAGSPQRFDQGQNDGQKSGFFLNFGNQTQSFDQKYNSGDYFNPMKR